MGEEAEDIKDDVVDDVVDDNTPDTSTPKYSPTEQKARDSGWVPKDQFEGNEDDFVDYPEFVRRGELYDAIHKANRKSKKLEEQLNLLTEHQSKVAKVAYEKALAKLKEEKRLAAQEGDLARVIDLDEEIDSYKAQAPEVVAPPKDDTPYDVFMERNADWYEKDEILTDYAVGYGGRVERKHTDWTPEQVLAEVERAVKEKFPEKFGNANREKPAPVSRSTNGSKVSGKKRITYDDLDESGKQMYRKLVKSKTNPNGALKPEQYLKDYALVSGLEWED